MSKIVQTIGLAILGQFAIPVAGISAIVALLSLIPLVFISGARGTALMVFIVSALIFYVAFSFLKNMRRKGADFIEGINRQESLAINPANMLGYPGVAFVAFDKQNRKVVACSNASGHYTIYDFSYVLKWYYEWGTGYRSVDIGHQPIPGTPMTVPVMGTEEYAKNFTLVLEVANENQPFMKFPMQGERSAKEWCAKLNAIFNG